MRSKMLLFLLVLLCIQNSYGQQYGIVQLTLNDYQGIDLSQLEIENLVYDVTFNQPITTEYQKIEDGKYKITIPLAMEQEALLNLNWFAKDAFNAKGIPYFIQPGDTLSIIMGLNNQEPATFKGKNATAVRQFSQFKQKQWDFIEKEILKGKVNDPILSMDSPEKVKSVLSTRTATLNSQVQKTNIVTNERLKEIELANLHYLPKFEWMQYCLANKIKEPKTEGIASVFETKKNVDSLALFRQNAVGFWGIYNRYLTQKVQRYAPKKMLDLALQNLEALPPENQSKLAKLQTKETWDAADFQLYYAILKGYRDQLVPLYFSTYGDEYVNEYLKLPEGNIRALLMAQYFNQIIKVFPKDYIDLVFPLIKNNLHHAGLEFRLQYEYDLFLSASE